MDPTTVGDVLSDAARDAPITVLGAGLTGLSASMELRRAGVPHRLVDKNPHAGGHAATIEEVGYRFDRTGHLLHVRDPALKGEILSWLGPENVLEIDRKSVVWSNGVYTPYPFQANTYGLPPDIAYECVVGFVKAHFDREPRTPATFEDFCLRHFGEGISRHFMVPYNEKLLGVHPRQITAAWCDRFVPIPKLEDVLGGALGVRRNELGYNTRFLYPRLGIGELVRVLADRAGAVELGRSPRAIDWKRRRIDWGDGVETSYQSLVSTLPLDVLAKLLVDAPEPVRRAGSLLRCTHLYYLDVALNTRCEKPWHWAYVPEPKYPFYRVGAYSSFSAAMVPPGKGSLYVELADRNEPDLATLLPRVADDLVEMGIVRAREAIRFARVRRIDHAYVVFDAAHADAVGTLLPFLEENGILSVGRYGAWTYASMEDALVSGRKAARDALARLEHPR
jgi:protoporphyrinogen oxidase